MTSHQSFSAILVLSGLVLLGAFSGVFRGKSALPSSETQSLLQIPETSLNVGSVWASGEVRHSLPIVNSGRKVQRIVGFRTSCSCTSIEPSQLVLAPGESAEVTISIDLRPPTLSAAQEPQWKFAVSFSPVIESETERPPEWTLTGTAMNAVSLPAGFDFGELLRFSPDSGGGGEVEFRVHLPDLKLTAGCDPSLGEVVLVRDPDDKARVEMRFLPADELLPGRIDVPVRLAATLDDGSSLPELLVTGSALLRDRIEAFPGSIDFGPVAIHESADGSITFLSIDGRPVEILEVSGTQPGVLEALPGRDSENNANCRIRLTPRTSGRITKTVRFTLQDGRSDRPVLLNVSVTAHGWTGDNGSTTKIPNCGTGE